MKKLLALVLAALFCLLAACGSEDASVSTTAGSGDTSSSTSSEPAPPAGEEPEETPHPKEDASSASSMVATHTEHGDFFVPADSPAIGPWSDPDSYEGVWETMTLVDVRANPQGSLSLTAFGEEHGLLTFGAPQAVAYSADLEGDRTLAPGMTVRVGFDGEVMETYPGQIIADCLIAESRDGGLIPLYLDVLEELYSGHDSGLNGDCAYFGFDLTEAEGLTEQEQQAVGWLFASSHGCEPLYGTIEELGDQGFIDMDNLYWKDGLHFRLNASSVGKNHFTLECAKWKSGLGAYGYQLTIGKKGGKWTAGEPEAVWIS